MDTRNSKIKNQFSRTCTSQDPEILNDLYQHLHWFDSVPYKERSWQTVAQQACFHIWPEIKHYKQ